MTSESKKYLNLTPPPHIACLINRVESGLAEGKEIFKLAQWYRSEYDEWNYGPYILKCAELYKLATEHGSEEAQFYLAMCYLRGEGVPRDYEEAMKRIWIGAHEGDSTSQNYLGLLYSKQRDSVFERSEFALLAPEPDIIEAYAWINLAGAKYAGFRQNLDSIAGQLTAEQTLAAQKRSKEILADIEARITANKKADKK
ncbi:MAG: sel1 repeat family protein [Verrucomicrobia bacterium]|nr:sel1 repeat family protein [Verrucomicrobiota bacterium]